MFLLAMQLNQELASIDQLGLTVNSQDRFAGCFREQKERYSNGSVKNLGYSSDKYLTRNLTAKANDTLSERAKIIVFLLTARSDIAARLGYLPETFQDIADMSRSSLGPILGSSTRTETGSSTNIPSISSDFFRLDSMIFQGNDVIYNIPINSSPSQCPFTPNFNCLISLLIYFNLCRISCPSKPLRIRHSETEANVSTFQGL